MITVSAGIIEKDNKILIGRRSPHEKAPGLWEFPGGKLEDGESRQECLKRELEEELGIVAEIGPLFSEYIYKYPHVAYQLYFYIVRKFSGELQYNSHDMLEWVTADQFDDYDFLPGDQPLLEEIRNKYA